MEVREGEWGKRGGKKEGRGERRRDTTLKPLNAQMITDTNKGYAQSKTESCIMKEATKL